MEVLCEGLFIYRNKLDYLDKSKFPKYLNGKELYLQYQNTNLYASSEEPSKAIEIYKDFYIDLFKPKHISNWGPVTTNNTYEQNISQLTPGNVSEVAVYEADGTLQWFCFRDNNSLLKYSISFINNQLFVTEELYSADANPLPPLPNTSISPFFPNLYFFPKNHILSIVAIPKQRRHR